MVIQNEFKCEGGVEKSQLMSLYRVKAGTLGLSVVRISEGTGVH